MNKRLEPVVEVVEVRFIALPSARQLKDAGISQGQANAYNRAQWLIAKAQERAACIAAEILRPQDVEQAKWERKATVEEANRKYRERCLAVFSETCTKGIL